MNINISEVWLNYIWPTIKIISIVAGIVTPIIIFYVKKKIESEMKQAEYIHNSRWDIKRKACFDAIPYL